MIGMQYLKVLGSHGNRVVGLDPFSWKTDEYAKEYFLNMLKNGGLIHDFSPTQILVIKASRLDLIEAVLFSGKQDEMAELHKITEDFEERFKGFKEYVGEIKDRKAFLALSDEFDSFGKGEN